MSICKQRKNATKKPLFQLHIAVGHAFQSVLLEKKDERFVKSISIVKDKNHIFKDFLCPFKKTFLRKLCMHSTTQFYAHQKQNTQIYGSALNKLFFSYFIIRKF